jgi:hypothetical protein
MRILWPLFVSALLPTTLSGALRSAGPYTDRLDVDDGSIPIDNTLVERLHRRPAIGKRNFLFVGSHAGGERAAIAYSLLGTCRLIGLNPVVYLGAVLPELARGIEFEQVESFMPNAWKLAHPDAALRPLR